MMNNGLKPAVKSMPYPNESLRQARFRTGPGKGMNDSMHQARRSQKNPPGGRFEDQVWDGLASAIHACKRKWPRGIRTRAWGN
jgi:hypothetical protein